MRVLIDECVDPRVKFLLGDHRVGSLEFQQTSPSNRTCGAAYSGRGLAFSESSRLEKAAAGKIARPTKRKIKDRSEVLGVMPGLLRPRRTDLTLYF
jgi:hypothetical protein